jgi:hypothetical protein
MCKPVRSYLLHSSLSLSDAWVKLCKNVGPNQFAELNPHNLTFCSCNFFNVKRPNTEHRWGQSSGLCQSNRKESNCSPVLYMHAHAHVHEHSE